MQETLCIQLSERAAEISADPSTRLTPYGCRATRKSALMCGSIELATRACPFRTGREVNCDVNSQPTAHSSQPTGHRWPASLTQHAMCSCDAEGHRRSNGGTSRAMGRAKWDVGREQTGRDVGHGTGREQGRGVAQCIKHQIRNSTRI